MPVNISPTQQTDLLNSQLVATQQDFQQLLDRYSELSSHQSKLLQELIAVQKTVVNLGRVVHDMLSFLDSVHAQRQRENRFIAPFALPTANDGVSAERSTESCPMYGNEDVVPIEPLQHASNLLRELDTEQLVDRKNVEQLSGLYTRANTTHVAPPHVDGRRSPSRGISSQASQPIISPELVFHGDFDGVVYPIGQAQGIDPMNSDHINNIPYVETPAAPETTFQRTKGRNRIAVDDPGWIRQPQILLVEDDKTCRRIGGVFLYALQCQVDFAEDGLQAVAKFSAGVRYDLVLMDIVMPNLDGVSASHHIRQFDCAPIIAMTSNLSSNHIAMYFQHGRLRGSQILAEVSTDVRQE